MFKKILIANRGEIAVRVIKACQTALLFQTWNIFVVLRVVPGFMMMLQWQRLKCKEKVYQLKNDFNFVYIQLKE